jgi:predicted transposase YbfD/YdcC
VEVVAPQVGHLETVEALMAQAGVRQTKSQHNHQPMMVVGVMAEVAETILVIRTTMVMSPSRTSTTQVKVIEDAGNLRTRKRTLSVLQCQMPYVSERG